MPDHTYSTILASFIGFSGAHTVGGPAGCKLLLVRFTAIPPSATLQTPLPNGPYFGLGHYQWRTGVIGAMPNQAITAYGPLRFTLQGIVPVTGHEQQLRIWSPPGGVYDLFFMSQ